MNPGAEGICDGELDWLPGRMTWTAPARRGKLSKRITRIWGGQPSTINESRRAGKQRANWFWVRRVHAMPSGIGVWVGVWI